MRAGRRARGWGSWLRLVIPADDARRMVRLVAMDEVMPVHTSVPDAIAAAGREITATQPDHDWRDWHRRHLMLGWRQGQAAAWDC